MINTLEINQVYLVTGITDMRKSINGLSIIISEQLGHDPFNGSLFVFCNRHKDKLKILYWENNGFWLYYRRLEKGKFQWPTEDNQHQTQPLSYQELRWLLEGLSLIQPQSHQALTGLKND